MNSLMNPILLIWAFQAITFSSRLQDDLILFDGNSLDRWEVIDFEGHGEISIVDSTIVIGKGELISGIRWTDEFPKINYEVSLSAKRVSGGDFFCGMTFPVRESCLTLIIGGWHGTLSGLSCIDGYDAANNQTGIVYYYGSDIWYDIRLRVSDDKIEAWVGEDKIVDFNIGKSRLSLRWEVESSAPFGITTYKTTGVLRDLRLRLINE
jgi:hypothetical protein